MFYPKKKKLTKISFKRKTVTYVKIERFNGGLLAIFFILAKFSY